MLTFFIGYLINIVNNTIVSADITKLKENDPGSDKNPWWNPILPAKTPCCGLSVYGLVSYETIITILVMYDLLYLFSNNYSFMDMVDLKAVSNLCLQMSHFPVNFPIFRVLGLNSNTTAMEQILTS